MSADSDTPVPAGASPLRFEVTPYQSDGGYSPLGLLVCLGLVFGFAAGLGYLAHFLTSWLPGIEYAVAIGLGFALAGLGSLAGYWAKIRSPAAAGLAGLLGGALTLLAVHYWKYQDGLPALRTDVKHYVWRRMALAGQQQRAGKNKPPFRVREEERGPIPASIARELEPVLRKPVKDDEVNRAVDEAVARFSFWDYMDWKATEGAPLALPKVRKEIRLGHAGSYILWAVEALVIGGIAAGIMALRARRPFCPACNVWKQERPLGRLRLDPPRAVALFTSGTLAELAGEDLARDDGPVQVSVHTCPLCEEEAPADVKLTHVVKTDKDKEQTSELAHLTYPGPAVRVLEALFAPLEPPPDEVTSPTHPADQTHG
jgi:hypothetical protein